MSPSPEIAEMMDVRTSRRALESTPELVVEIASAMFGWDAPRIGNGNQAFCDLEGAEQRRFLKYAEIAIELCASSVAWPIEDAEEAVPDAKPSA